MATSVDAVHKSLDLVKDYSCLSCESKNIKESAEFFCETCLKCFCNKCLYHHDQIYVNHLKYGREETNKWPLAKKMEDLLLKCDVHSNNNLGMFCQDHSQLCCSDCVLMNHRQCSNLDLISESVKTLSVDIQQLSRKIQTTLSELNKFKRTQEASIPSVEGSYNEKQQEIREMRNKLNAALDELENTTLKELYEIKTTLQTSLKKGVDNCSRLNDELQLLGDAVNGLGDESKKELEFIAGRKCLDKIQEAESYLKENPVTVQRSMVFQANTDIVQDLSKHSSLWRFVDSKQSPKKEMNPDQVLTVKSKSYFNVKIASDKKQTCYISGICILPSGETIVADYNNKRVKLLDKHYNIVSSDLEVDSNPQDICQISLSQVAIIFVNSVQFINVINGKLVIGHLLKGYDDTRELPHATLGINYHQGDLYITSGTALYHYTLTQYGKLWKHKKSLYEDTRGGITVYKCAFSPDGDLIFVLNFAQNKLITLTIDGTLISKFTDPELQGPKGVHVTPTGQVLVCGISSHTVIQVDREGKKKLATLASENDGLRYPVSVCYNTNTDQMSVGLFASNNISVMELK
ncbi:uncharacterized protein LOC127848500 isoform X2 [Dreissena polymorpha]|uniref:uncharacterized protein LOC127848500 isoform X2 n=1 Tax=Dreissena polymorpha TaxID=45954 RepID=UPI0022643AE5|nr:uncharacterized protein LOC127848500 isoform X2 [Dreissena polymorpha]